MTPAAFIRQLSAVSFENVFNPYSDRCIQCDVDDAPAIRARALHSMICAAMRCELDAVWVGRDLGYRGGRRTGLALTDDAHLSLHLERWGIKPSRPTIGEVVKERTAAVIWSCLRKISKPIFLWNVFPFHPHQPGDPFSNRAHRSAERIVGEEILWSLVDLLRPRMVVAIGNDAAATMAASSIAVMQVRHPSYGGQSQFRRQIEELYGLGPGPF